MRPRVSSAARVVLACPQPTTARRLVSLATPCSFWHGRCARASLGARSFVRTSPRHALPVCAHEHDRATHMHLRALRSVPRVALFSATTAPQVRRLAAFCIASHLAGGCMQWDCHFAGSAALASLLSFGKAESLALIYERSVFVRASGWMPLFTVFTYHKRGRGVVHFSSNSNPCAHIHAAPHAYTRSSRYTDHA